MAQHRALPWLRRRWGPGASRPAISSGSIPDPPLPALLPPLLLPGPPVLLQHLHDGDGPAQLPPTLWTPPAPQCSPTACEGRGGEEEEGRKARGEVHRGFEHQHQGGAEEEEQNKRGEGAPPVSAFHVPPKTACQGVKELRGECEGGEERSELESERGELVEKVQG